MRCAREPVGQQGGFAEAGRGGDHGEEAGEPPVEPCEEARARHPFGARLGYVEFGAE